MSTRPQIAELLAALHRACSENDVHWDSEVARVKDERDEAQKQVHATQIELGKQVHSAQLELEQVKQELAVRSVSLKHAEQTDTIVHLRREIAQLKGQALNWQEHFLRVEQERCVLSTRIEELEFHRIHRTSLDTAPLTPVSRHPDERSSSSASLPPKSKIPLIPLSPPEPGPSARPPRNLLLTGPKSKAEPSQLSTSLHKPSQPVMTRVIRRVQTVIRVKQEDESEEDPPAYAAAEQSHRNRSAGKRSRMTVQDEPDDWSSGSRSPAHMADDEEDEDEDDPLRIGAQSNDHVPKTPGRTRVATPPNPPTKRRKVAANARQNPVRRKP
ncbi:hypothetical protein C8J56DRAFT_880456 [Mycena floridula]|nr:hypothetical protein C8J56DRAFT_880456 [Mycena floridula]